MPGVTISCRGDGIFQLALNAPESQNRLSAELCAELESTLAQLASEPSVKVLVVTGRKEVFCAGATRDLLDEIAGGRMHVRDLPLPRHLTGFPVPTVVALEGHAVGGGLALAVLCDIRVASESHRYGFNFAEMGFTPETGMSLLLPQLVGHSFALEMLLTARLYKGRELQDRGLFNYVVPAGEVLEAALDLAARMAERPRHVLQMVKAMLARSRHSALIEAELAEHLMHQVCFGHPETAALIDTNYLSPVEVKAG